MVEIMSKAPAVFCLTGLNVTRGDLLHENLYSIMKDFHSFILNVPIHLSAEANLVYASFYNIYTDVLTNHDVYIWLAAYRENNFKFLLQIFYNPSEEDYNTNGPYVPLKIFLTQIHSGYLTNFYTV